MKIKEILAAGKPAVSFEVFPPKADASFEPIRAAVARLAQQRPTFMSVTYGASGNAQANTAEVAAFVQSLGVPALAHLTCVAASRDKIEEETSALRAAGIENILCLRGDLPRDLAEPPPGHFTHAVDLVRALKPCGFCLGGACYPECHPDCAHMDDDIEYLKQKVDAGLDFVTTQMFFDNNIFYRYLAKLRTRGVTVPVIDCRPFRQRRPRRARLHDEPSRGGRAHHGEPPRDRGLSENGGLDEEMGFHWMVHHSAGVPCGLRRGRRAARHGFRRPFVRAERPASRVERPDARVAPRRT